MTLERSLLFPFFQGGFDTDTSSEPCRRSVGAAPRIEAGVAKSSPSSCLYRGKVWGPRHVLGSSDGVVFTSRRQNPWTRNHRLRAARDLLLPRLMSGEIAV